MAAFEAWLVFLILVVNVVGELQRKRTLAASRGFLAAGRLSCLICVDDVRPPHCRWTRYTVTHKGACAYPAGDQILICHWSLVARSVFPVSFFQITP